MQQDDLIGTTLGGHRILSSLGQGGMARVYRAYQENLDREVAVKVLPPWFAADRNFVERFNLEAKLVARLSHPNIVTVHDANEQQGHLYIVMQLVDGGTLKQRLEQGKTIAAQEVISIFTQIASALSYAHEQGIIHRDVKPVNVLMDKSGRPILSDFGIAKVLASTNDNLTRPGAGVGTPEYMSPEQCQGVAVDGRADIYALGVMLFEALAGRTPFRADNYPALAHSHLYEPPPSPRSINPAIPPGVERVILTALMKNPQHRFQSASEMADALQRAFIATSNVAMVQGGMPSQPGQFSPSLSGPSISPPELLYKCPTCQRPNKGQVRFCTKCGAPMNRCMTCGVQNPANNRFCTRCGRPLRPQVM